MYIIIQSYWQSFILLNLPSAHVFTMTMCFLPHTNQWGFLAVILQLYDYTIRFILLEIKTKKIYNFLFHCL